MERKPIISRLNDYNEDNYFDDTLRYEIIYSTYNKDNVNLKSSNKIESCYSNIRYDDFEYIIITIPESCIYNLNFIKRYVKIVNLITKNIDLKITDYNIKIYKKNDFNLLLCTLTLLRYLWENNYDNFRLIPYWVVFINKYNPELTIMENLCISHFNHIHRFSHSGHSIMSRKSKLKDSFELSYNGVHSSFMSTDYNELRLTKFKNKEELKITIQQWNQLKQKQ
jgi:hypothetical protein